MTLVLAPQMAAEEGREVQGRESASQLNLKDRRFMREIVLQCFESFNQFHNIVPF